MRRLFAYSVAALFLALAAGGGAGWWAWQVLHRPFGEVPPVRTITIERGQDARSILAELEEAAILADADLARAYLVYRLGDPPLKAGEYRFETPLSSVEVLARLIRGQVTTYPVTVIEGLTREEVAEVLATAGFGDRARFLAETARGDRIADLDPAATDLEGYLYPDTYSFARGTPESEIVDTLVRTFRQRWQEEVAPLLRGREEPAVRELVTLASIVEKEARLAEERPVIAGVYANRLRQGIALYADPTVIFALKLRGTWDGNLRRPDLKLDSPYNTYVYPGLPPGPICSPRVESLIAAAAPADVPYLYFVSRNDGSHVFAETLREHNRNVEVWQKEYWRQRWQAERSSR